MTVIAASNYASGLVAAILSIALLAACSQGPEKYEATHLSGAVMGTQYNITIVPTAAQSGLNLQADISAVFSKLNKRFSTYDKDSELSRFNQHDSTQWFQSSYELCAAVDRALAISDSTAGAFDPTIGRLVNLWGFGSDDVQFEPPVEIAVIEAQQTTGFQKLHTNCEQNRIRKDHPSLYLDLSGYAKGIAVDQVAELLDENQIPNYLVELGGEIRVRGLNASRQPWRIAVEQPIDDERAVSRALRVSDVAIATSGDYRNFFVHEGIRYSHTIDPQTGRPVTHQTASVTVIADDAAFADAMATALLVMGHEKGFSFAETHQLAAYFLLRSGGESDGFATSRFAPFIETP